MTRTVHVVPHTHWDREWYRTFQSFRMELVELVDDTLDLLETEPDFAYFMLDGQMAVIDDYLAIRPEQRPRLESLARAGRLLMGPWYILMDEFLVSGETIVRDLELGLAKAATFGGAMPVGYLPDMFGHIAQMPQILRSFGFADTVVWRGVPEEVAREASFAWHAPDGSHVTAQYLPRGYGNGVDLPPTVDELVTRVELFTAQTGARSGTGDDPVLWMHGTDHRHPLPRLVPMIAEANARQDDWRFEVSSLPRYISEQTRRHPPTRTWTGELRSGARANLLMGVASNRVDVKIAAARAERGLERLAEPLSALLLPGDRWPRAYLDEAWHFVILNSAHDSICACSHDDVVEAVRARFAEANAIADGLVDRAMVAAMALGTQARPEAHAIVVNPSARRRSGLVELTVVGDSDPPGSQVVHERPGTLPMTTTTVLGAIDWLDIVEDHIGEVNRIDITDQGDHVEIVLRSDVARFGLLDTDAARQHLAALAAQQPDRPASLSMSTLANRTVLAHAADVAGFGWAALLPEPPDVEPVHAAGRSMSNGLVTVEVAADGTFSMNGIAGMGRLVDDGDKGDTYNWCPPAHDTIVDTADRVDVEVLEAGPLRARIGIAAQYEWPTGVDGERRVGATTTTVSTVLELQAGQDIVHVEVSFDNASRDHRLRAWFPLVEPAHESTAECAFGTVRRGLTAEGGLTEAGLATQPSRRFVQAGGLTVAHEGLVEYELVDLVETDAGPRANAIAVTLLRATGLLSQAPMATRALPAGPVQRLEGPQMLGRHQVRYALHMGDRDPYAIVDDAFLPLLAVGAMPEERQGTATGATGGTWLEVTGAEVSALRRRPDALDELELRVFNPSDQPTMVHVTNCSGRLVTLGGDVTGTFQESFELRPRGIQTVHLDP